MLKWLEGIPMLKRLKGKRKVRVGQIARKMFGYEQLRPGQEAALQALMEGHDTLVVMPTGSGKSMIYQAAGKLIDGPTVIVSPLIALQYDQVETIKEQDLGGAALINSTLRPAEWRETLQNLKEGELEFLFLAPEQFNREETLQELKNARPSLFVIDEAHCISEWGHDFRPEYLRLGSVIEELGRPRILALTATASLPVRNEILERLDMQAPVIVVQGFDRPNIWLGLETFQDEEEKKRALLARVVQAQKPGIVYATTRKQVEDVAAGLRARGVKAAFYHAGMRAKDREQVQNAFMDDELEVIVATTAFGMGIDKADVRFVYHYTISDSIDSYYQEIGRAGRDGKEAEAILFYYPKDLGLRHFLASSGRVDSEQVELVARVIQEHDGPVDPKALCEELALSKTKMMQILTRLEELEVIENLPNGDVVLKDQPENLDEIAEEAAQMHEARRQYDRSRVEMMRGYAELHNCRREYLLNYFGEPFAAPCYFCNNCDAGITEGEDGESRPFPLNSNVVHTTWGEGTVLRYEDDKIVVLFESVGYKTLSLDIVMENHLLEPA